MMSKIYFQGTFGAYSHLAALSIYANAEIAASSLEIALEKNDWESVDLQMCNLGNACGTCHASFRRLLTSQLANEASAWSGKYISNCK